jgi:hypothetical protein
MVSRQPLRKGAGSLGKSRCQTRLRQKATAILATSFPEWLPPAVAREARRILENSSNPDRALILRLTTDNRMKRAWKELSTLKYERPQLDETVVTMRGPLNDHLTDQEAALMMVLWWAYVLAYAPVAVATIRELDLLLASCENAAKQLRTLAAITLRMQLSSMTRQHRQLSSRKLQIRSLLTDLDIIVQRAPTLSI